MSARRLVTWPALLTNLALFHATLAHAKSEPSDPVLVLLGPNNQETTSEVMLRIEGELLADGFRVEPLHSSIPAERQGVVRNWCGRLRGSIMVGVFVDERTGKVEMRFCDAASHRDALRYEQLPASSAAEPPEAIARHTVDLLRAGLLDFAVETMHLAARAAPEQSASRPPSPVPERATFRMRGAIEPGASVIVGFGGLPASITPVLRLRAAMTPQLELRATAAGLGTTPRLGTTRGSATVAQKLGVADVAWSIAPSTWLSPLIVLGAGAYEATVSGAGRAPYSGVSSGGVAFSLDAGVGVSPWVTPSLSVAVEVHAIYCIPTLAVRFVDADAAQLGQPMLMLSVGLAEWL